MVTVIMASALFGLGIALYYYLKVANIPLTQGIENSAEAEKLTKIPVSYTHLRAHET